MRTFIVIFGAVALAIIVGGVILKAIFDRQRADQWRRYTETENRRLKNRGPVGFAPAIA